MTGIDHELETLAQQGDLASFCPHCHAALNVYDDEDQARLGRPRRGGRRRGAATSS